MKRQRDKRYAEMCGVCGITHEDVFYKWYGANVPLCPSCRRLVVLRFDRDNPKINIFPGESDNYLYYHKIRAYIENLATLPVASRQPYIDQSAPRVEVEREPTPLPTTKLSQKRAEEAAAKKEFQLVLFADFPP